MIRNARWVILDVENRPTADSLPLGQEVVLQGLSSPDFSFYPIPMENNWESFSLKRWGPKQRSLR
jgi:hypothetical protein